MLAVTTYPNIITAPFFTRLADDDKGYLQAARQEEMSHYLLEQSVPGKPSPDWLPQADWVILDDVGHCAQLDVPVQAAELII